MTRRDFSKIDKLHALLDVAVQDGLAIIQDQRYCPDALLFHKPLWTGYCHICLAGAVIAKTLNANHQEIHEPEDFYNDGCVTRLRAIDSLRSGDIRSALELIGRGDEHDETKHLDAPELENPEFTGVKEFRRFLDTACDLREWLKAHNL